MGVISCFCELYCTVGSDAMMSITITKIKFFQSTTANWFALQTSYRYSNMETLKQLYMAFGSIGPVKQTCMVFCSFLSRFC